MSEIKTNNDKEIKVKIIIISSKYQDKKWRKSQEWYKNGKHNECEKYQINQIKNITELKIEKTNKRLNFETLEIKEYRNPNKKKDGFDWSENFDGYNKKYNIYFNLKFVCDKGGSQTRSLREVYHFIHNQLKYLLKNIDKNVIFINILDGNTSYDNIDKYNYLLEKKIFSNFRDKCFVGNMKEFNTWYINFQKINENDLISNNS